MGREIKRVPLNFEWPIDTIWSGYVNPFYQQCEECQECGGTGGSPESNRLKDKWYGNAQFRPEERGSVPFAPEHPTVRAMAERNISRSPEYYGTGEFNIRMEAIRLADLFNGQWCHHLNNDDVAALIAAGRLYDFTHVPRTEDQREIVRLKMQGGGNSWLPESNGYIPSPQEVNDWSIGGFGHDSINSWMVIKAECARLGINDTCKKCQGEGTLWPSEAAKKQYEDWARSEPPAGAGFQLWETVSEGSPISPVFEHAEDLAAWLATSADFKWRNLHRGTTSEQWVKFILGPSWAPSMIVSPETGVMDGVRAMVSNL